MCEEHEGTQKGNKEVRQLQEVDGVEETLRDARFRWYTQVGKRQIPPLRGKSCRIAPDCGKSDTGISANRWKDTVKKDMESGGGG